MSHSRPESPAASAKPATSLSTSFTALICLAGLAAIWGYNWVAMKVGVRYAEPFTFAALRAFLGAVFLFPLVAALRRPLRLQAPLLTAVLGILQTTAFVGLTLWALEQGAAGRTSVLVYTMPFWLLLMAWVFLGERVRGSQWAAVGLALLGLVFILRPWRLEGTATSSLLAVAAGFCWAASAVLVKVLQKRRQVDLLSFTAWQMLIGAIPLVIIALIRADTPPVWNAPFIAALAFNVLPASALAWLLWLFVLRTLPAGTAGVGTLAIPVVGVVAAWLQLGERPTPLEGVGMLLILIALGALTVRGFVLSRRARVASADPQEL
jgi:drug/metabolite transporter (DMT)-like permease